MNIIGISAFYHESACCLIQDGKLKAAASEERFTRLKNDRRSPINAFRYCLEEGGNLTPSDIDCIAYYESSKKKLSRKLSMGLNASVDPTFAWLDSFQPERELRDTLGYNGQFLAFDHHLSHGAGSFFYSGFRDAAIFTVDGVGEWTTTSYGAGENNKITILEEVIFPDSLGLLYSTLTDYLGFPVLIDEYKVMGLAYQGQPRFIKEIQSLITTGERGQFSLNMDYFEFTGKDRIFTDVMIDLFKFPLRISGNPIEQIHRDIAKSLQMVLEDILIQKTRFLHQIVPGENLCLSGGVALNSAANRRLHLDGPFKNIFIQPASGDSGSALGAAALAHIQITGGRHSYEAIPHMFLGPDYETDFIASLLKESGIEALDFRGNEAGLLEAVIDRLTNQKIIGWFHGKMEFGSRGLGARSIIADPRDSNLRDRLNDVTRKQDGFTPLAMGILENYADEYMGIQHQSRFMTEICKVRKDIDIASISNSDGSVYVQTIDAETNPRFTRLMECFLKRTGLPVIINESFNVRGEPIVCSAEDALMSMANSQIDCLVLEDFIIDKKSIPVFLRKTAFVGDTAMQDRVVTKVHPGLKGRVERWRPAEGMPPQGGSIFN